MIHVLSEVITSGGVDHDNSNNEFRTQIEMLNFKISRLKATEVYLLNVLQWPELSTLIILLMKVAM